MPAPDALPTPPGSGSCLFFVGTSGYFYDEWLDAGIYPAGIKKAQMLPEYARLFPFVELNYTYYAMPRAEAIERQRLLTPPGFLFSAKLTKTLTHEIVPAKWKAEAGSYRDGIAPLLQSNQLAATLAQFGPRFDRSANNRNYLAALLDELAGIPVAVEFRNSTWADPKVYAELERRNVTLVAVDEPRLPGLFPPLTEVTNPGLAYVRFHGRNVKGWRSGEMPSQFDYDYRDDELQEWVEEKLSQIGMRAARCLIAFNNHVRGQAPNNSRRLTELLNRAGCQCASVRSST
jgi:uncharacterized protein YecE (DUF72 family)